MKTCPQCGQQLRPDQLLCQCGLPVGAPQPDLGDLGQVKIGMPSLDLDRTRMPAFDLSFPGSKGISLPGFDISQPETNLDLRTRQNVRGRPFRVVLAIGGREGVAVRLKSPMAVASLASRDFLVLDLGDGNGALRIQQFDSEGGLRRVLHRSDGTSQAETALIPVALTVDGQAHMFVSDMDSSAIKEYDSEGAWVASYGQEGMSEGEMNSPRGIAADTAGSIYVADSGNNRIVCWSEGKQQLVAGINRLDEEQGWLQSGDGPGEFDDPQGLALGDDGYIFVADTNNHRIQILDAAGRFVRAFGTEGEEKGQLSYPSHARAGRDGAIYVADLGGRRLQKFSSNGESAYEIVLPVDMGAISDFAVDADGRILLAFRTNDVVAGIEVE